MQSILVQLPARILAVVVGPGVSHQLVSWALGRQTHIIVVGHREQLAGEKAVPPSPEHHSWADLEAVIKQKPAMVKHPITSQLGGEKRRQLWKYCLGKTRGGKRGEGRGSWQ